MRENDKTKRREGPEKEKKSLCPMFMFICGEKEEKQTNKTKKLIDERKTIISHFWATCI